jgi:hypothetical protein
MRPAKRSLDDLKLIAAFSLVAFVLSWIAATGFRLPPF